MSIKYQTAMEGVKYMTLDQLQIQELEKDVRHLRFICRAQMLTDLLLAATIVVLAGYAL